MSSEIAYFAGGCFWGMEHEYQKLPGVLTVVSGYMGGSTSQPTYREICDGDTGHAEVVQVTYDPSVTTYADLLEMFWEVHDPTTLNRQGVDVGHQYRSAIFTVSDAQEEQARASLEAAAVFFHSPIVTEIAPAPPFWPAEDYHQDYIERTGKASCHIRRKRVPVR